MPADRAPDTVTAESAARHVLWLELPQSGETKRATVTAGQYPCRDSWYDPAALYEEPERWDGMA